MMFDANWIIQYFSGQDLWFFRHLSWCARKCLPKLVTTVITNSTLRMRSWHRRKLAASAPWFASRGDGRKSRHWSSILGPTKCLGRIGLVRLVVATRFAGQFEQNNITIHLLLIEFTEISIYTLSSISFKMSQGRIQTCWLMLAAHLLRHLWLLLRGWASMLTLFIVHKWMKARKVLQNASFSPLSFEQQRTKEESI